MLSLCWDGDSLWGEGVCEHMPGRPPLSSDGLEGKVPGRDVLLAMLVRQNLVLLVWGAGKLWGSVIQTL